MKVLILNKLYSTYRIRSYPIKNQLIENEIVYVRQSKIVLYLSISDI